VPGIGDVSLPFEPSRTPLSHDFVDAADFMIRTCAALPGAVTLIGLGPLSNFGTALLREPSLSATAARVVIMGGSLDGTGNKAAHGDVTLQLLQALSSFRVALVPYRGVLRCAAVCCGVALCCDVRVVLCCIQ
jgi:hypothetical protein